MKKRLLSILLCLALTAAISPTFGLSGQAAQYDITIGTYTNDEYSSSVTFNSD